MLPPLTTGRRPWLQSLEPVTKFTEVLPSSGDSVARVVDRLHSGLRPEAGDAAVTLPPLSRRQLAVVPDEYGTRRVHDGWEAAANRRTMETTRNLQRLSSRRKAMVQKHLPRPPDKNQPASAFARTAKGGMGAEELFLRDDELTMKKARNVKIQEMAQQRRQLIQDLGAASRECAQEYRVAREHIRDERKRNLQSNGASMHSLFDNLSADEHGRSKGSDELLKTDRESMQPGDSVEWSIHEGSAAGRKAARRKSSILLSGNVDSSFEMPGPCPDPAAPKLRKLKFSIYRDMRGGDVAASADEASPACDQNGEISEVHRKHSCMPKLQSSRNSRLRMLSLLGNESRKQDAAKRSKEQKRLMFDSLPESEKDAFTRAFTQGKEEDDMEISLEVLGLEGHSEAEKDGIRQLCDEILDVEIDLYDFCFDLVPRTRRFLREMQRPRLLELFQKFDADKSGFLDRDECKEIVERFCSGGLDPEGTEQLQVAFENLVKESMESTKKKLPQEPKEMETTDETTIPSAKQDLKVPSFLRELTKKKSSASEGTEAPVPAADDQSEDGVDFDNFEELIAKVQEAKESIQRSRQQEILQETSLSLELFKTHRDELILLYEAFKCADNNNNGTLEWNEIAGILIDYGLLPKDQMEQSEIETLLSTHDADGNGAIDFGEFLGMMEDVRAAWRRRLEPELKNLFKKYDKDDGGSLSFSEVATMIGEMGLNPRTREDQDEIKQLLDNVDSDGSGELDFPEFMDLLQRIEEKLKSLQRRRDLKAGEELGFTHKQVCQLRGIFFKLDVNGDESISSHEIQMLAMLMRKRIRQERLMEVFREVDGEDGNGSLDFVEFMDIVQRLDLLELNSAQKFVEGVN